MKAYLLFGIIMISISIQAQVTRQWLARYNGPGNGGEVSKSVIVDTSGNIYVTGSSPGNGSGYDYATIKYDSVGVMQWVKRYNGPGNNNDYASSIVIDQLGNVYVTGASDGIGTGWDYATIKYNSTGTQLWVARYNGANSTGDEAKSIAVDQNGNVYITGQSHEGINFNDYTTIKYNSLGVEQWVRHYNGLGNSIDYAVALAVDQLGDVYVTGQSDGNENSDFVTIKYSSLGAQQWIARYEAPENNGEITVAMALDSSGNVYVTGYSYGNGTSADYATVKYNSSGVQLWVAGYNGPGNSIDKVNSIAVDVTGNVYVTGFSDGMIGTGSDYDYATIKYNSTGVQQWVERYNGPVNGYDEGKSLTVDSKGNIYVTGYSVGNVGGYDYTTIKYNSAGAQQWVERFNALANSSDLAESISTDQYGNVYVTGSSIGNGTNADYLTIKYSQQQSLNITSPLAGEKWIAGETDTIRWIGGQSDRFVSVEYSTDNGSTYIQIASDTPADSNKYIWKIPNDILTTKAKIRIRDVTYPEDSAVSNIFKIKGYILTRLNSSANYDAYTKFRDPYAFGNDSAAVWPVEFWQNFDYTGTDPFTGYNYLLGFSSLFLQAYSDDHPDWISWVRTFGVPACYYNTSFPPVYSPTAVQKWFDITDVWKGSCFGMSTSNILLFNNKIEFLNQYPSFPNSNPLLILPDDSVRTVINEFYTHQFGLEHRIYRATTGLLKTPNQTLGEIKAMLLDDDPLVRTLSIVSNDTTDPGGHSIMAYKVEQDTITPNLYYVFTYDNSYPGNLDSAIIVVDTAANNNNGTWSPLYAWTNWGGTKWFYLRDPAITYFVNPSMPKKQQSVSPFILGENELQILNTRKASVRITDQQGNLSGFANGILLNNITGSIPNIIENGSSGPPIGYDLPTADYSVQMSDFQDQNASISFYTANKVFKFYRNDAQLSEDDKFYFDSGVSAINPDQNTKSFNLINIINESGLEKVFLLSELNLSPNDSVKIINPDDNTLDLISYGSAKNYKIELNHASPLGLGRFENDIISIEQNTTHKLTPDWSNINDLQLVIYVDQGNDGTIDDSILVQNTVDVEDQGSLLSPNSYDLAQNYPNPFNPSTKIRWQSPVSSHQTLKVYDVLGNEVATVVDEFREAGRYEVTFDASSLSSGIYFYRLQVGSFVETKKMILMK